MGLLKILGGIGGGIAGFAVGGPVGAGIGASAGSQLGGLTEGQFFGGGGGGNSQLQQALNPGIGQFLRLARAAAPTQGEFQASAAMRGLGRDAAGRLGALQGQ